VLPRRLRGVRVRHQERLLRQPALRGRPADQGADSLSGGGARARARAVLRDHRPRPERTTHCYTYERPKWRSRERTIRSPDGHAHKRTDGLAFRSSYRRAHHHTHERTYSTPNVVTDGLADGLRVH